MFLKGENISIRALEPSDAYLLYQWENNHALWEVSCTQTPFSKAVLDEFVNAAFQDIYTNKQLRLMAVNETVLTDLSQIQSGRNVPLKRYLPLSL